MNEYFLNTPWTLGWGKWGTPNHVQGPNKVLKSSSFFVLIQSPKWAIYEAKINLFWMRQKAP